MIIQIQNPKKTVLIKGNGHLHLLLKAEEELHLLMASCHYDPTVFHENEKDERVYVHHHLQHL